MQSRGKKVSLRNGIWVEIEGWKRVSLEGPEKRKLGRKEQEQGPTVVNGTVKEYHPYRVFPTC